MALSELCSQIPETQPKDLPDLMAYSMLRSFVADLKPKPTTPGMEIWSEVRYKTTREINYPRWSDTVVIGGEVHTVALFSVYGEAPNGEAYTHNSLRCSCCLPDYKSYADLNEEYQACPAKDQVIVARTKAYKEQLSGEKLGRFTDKSLRKATVFLLDLAKKQRFSWPPSDRSDRLLIEPSAGVLGVSSERMLATAERLAQDNIIYIRGKEHPSMSLAA